MLQPFDYKDPAENKRHKFLVQSILPKEDMTTVDVEAYVSQFFCHFYFFWIGYII
jgi:hypothetical protein